MSLTLAPMLASRFMRPETHEHGRIYRAIEAVFDAMLSFYRRTLDMALRHQGFTLAVFFITMGITGVMIVYMPKGFFPIQDIGLLKGISEGAQSISPEEMKRLQLQVGEVILRDPAVEAFGSQIGTTGNSAQTGNTGRFDVVLKPKEERGLSASQVIPKFCRKSAIQLSKK